MSLAAEARASTTGLEPQFTSWEGGACAGAGDLLRRGQSPCPLLLKADRLAVPTEHGAGDSRAIVGGEAAVSPSLAGWELGTMLRGPKPHGGHPQALGDSPAGALASCPRQFPDTRVRTQDNATAMDSNLMMTQREGRLAEPGHPRAGENTAGKGCHTLHWAGRRRWAAHVTGFSPRTARSE